MANNSININKPLEEFKTPSERWYFTKEQLSNTPSRRMGIDADKELAYRQQSANFIQDMGQRLQVNQLCINTAIVYMHRFYMYHSFSDFHRNSICTCSIFLAAKVEEQPRKLEYVIKVANYCLNRENPTVVDTKSESYNNLSKELVANENVLLQTLGFDLAIDHPHTHVVKACQLVRASKDLAQTSYFMATNSLHLTTMCLQYRPSLVACVCIHLTYKWARWEIPKSKEGKLWYKYVDESATPEQLEALTAEFVEIFDKSPARLKKKIISIGGSSGGLMSFPTNFGASSTFTNSSQSQGHKPVKPTHPITSSSTGGSHQAFGTQLGHKPEVPQHVPSSTTQSIPKPHPIGNANQHYPHQQGNPKTTNHVPYKAFTAMHAKPLQNSHGIKRPATSQLQSNGKMPRPNPPVEITNPQNPQNPHLDAPLTGSLTENRATQVPNPTVSNLPSESDRNTIGSTKNALNSSVTVKDEAFVAEKPVVIKKEPVSSSAPFIKPSLPGSLWGYKPEPDVSHSHQPVKVENVKPEPVAPVSSSSSSVVVPAISSSYPVKTDLNGGIKLEPSGIKFTISSTGVGGSTVSSLSSSSVSSHSQVHEAAQKQQIPSSSGISSVLAPTLSSEEDDLVTSVGPGIASVSLGSLLLPDKSSVHDPGPVSEDDKIKKDKKKKKKKHKEKDKKHSHKDHDRDRHEKKRSKERKESESAGSSSSVLEQNCTTNKIKIVLGPPPGHVRTKTKGGGGVSVFTVNSEGEKKSSTTSRPRMMMVTMEEGEGGGGGGVGVTTNHLDLIDLNLVGNPSTTPTIITSNHINNHVSLNSSSTMGCSSTGELVMMVDMMDNHHQYHQQEESSGGGGGVNNTMMSSIMTKTMSSLVAAPSSSTSSKSTKGSSTTSLPNSNNTNHVTHRARKEKLICRSIVTSEPVPSVMDSDDGDGSPEFAFPTPLGIPTQPTTTMATNHVRPRGRPNLDGSGPTSSPSKSPKLSKSPHKTEKKPGKAGKGRAAESSTTDSPSTKSTKPLILPNPGIVMSPLPNIPFPDQRPIPYPEVRVSVNVNGLINPQTLPRKRGRPCNQASIDRMNEERNRITVQNIAATIENIVDREQKIATMRKAKKYRNGPSSNISSDADDDWRDLSSSSQSSRYRYGPSKFPPPSSTVTSAQPEDEQDEELMRTSNSLFRDMSLNPRTSSQSPSCGSQTGSLSSSPRRCYSRRRHGKLSEPFDTSHCCCPEYTCYEPRIQGLPFCALHLRASGLGGLSQCALHCPITGKACDQPLSGLDDRDMFCDTHSIGIAIARKRLSRQPENRHLLTNYQEHVSNSGPSGAGDGKSGKKDSMDDFSNIDMDVDVETVSDEGKTLDAYNFFQTDYDSDEDMYDTGESDPLRRAGYYTTEEVVTQYRSKLVELKKLYLGQQDHLKNVYKEKKRQYLINKNRLAKGNVPYTSNPKRLQSGITPFTPEYIAKQEEEKNKAIALLNFQGGKGREALFRNEAMKKYQKQQKELERPNLMALLGHQKTKSPDEDEILSPFSFREKCRREAHDGSTADSHRTEKQPSKNKYCAFHSDASGSVRCSERRLPLSKFCKTHILHDENQVLFKPCNASIGEDSCQTPILSILEELGCPLHRVPLVEDLPESKETKKERIGGEAALPEATGEEEVEFMEEFVIDQLKSVQQFDQHVRYLEEKGLSGSDTEYSEDDEEEDKDKEKKDMNSVGSSSKK